jgi:hypothetical protein
MLRRLRPARWVLRLLLSANVVPSSPILDTLMMEVIGSSETLALTRATRIRRRRSSVGHEAGIRDLLSSILGYIRYSKWYSSCPSALAHDVAGSRWNSQRFILSSIWFYMLGYKFKQHIDVNYILTQDINNNPFILFLCVSAISLWITLCKNPKTELIFSRTRAAYMNYKTWIWICYWVHSHKITTTTDYNHWENLSTGSFWTGFLWTPFAFCVFCLVAQSSDPSRCNRQLRKLTCLWSKQKHMLPPARLLTSNHETAAEGVTLVTRFPSSIVNTKRITISIINPTTYWLTDRQSQNDSDSDWELYWEIL